MLSHCYFYKSLGIANFITMNFLYIFIFVLPLINADTRLIRTDREDMVVVEFNTTNKKHGITWAYDNWEKCSFQTHDKCGKTRNVACISFSKRENLASLVSPEFCSSLQKPVDSSICKTCSQDCVMTTWIPWSDCSTTCKSATRYRTRTLVQEPTNGGKKCGPLSEIVQCRGLPECVNNHVITVYHWKINEWTSCRKTKSIPVNARCSERLGERIRLVECVDDQGQSVSTENCIYRLSGQFCCYVSTKPFLVRVIDRGPCGRAPFWPLFGAADRSRRAHRP
ncbi:thrombospondin type-1 domain-containing protein 7A-like isoform X2 [Anneissia japonica]|uniref:thrombospondin type-1 domain-containing protein 7A-like isoform X2 n=1 Tax=Anneissia japonica TaxID=1529436 RepID=UPI0014256CDB|nr:thrombospondin type-1 domain-containing protein 7A-like isoform X2 [Anneissia japonica]